MTFTAEQVARRAFYETETGKLLRRFEAALGSAWVTDQRENASNAAMDRDWAKANAARDALIAHLEADRYWQGFDDAIETGALIAEKAAAINTAMGSEPGADIARKFSGEIGGRVAETIARHIRSAAHEARLQKDIAP